VCKKMNKKKVPSAARKRTLSKGSLPPRRVRPEGQRRTLRVEGSKSPREPNLTFQEESIRARPGDTRPGNQKTRLLVKKAGKSRELYLRIGRHSANSRRVQSKGERHKIDHEKDACGAVTGKGQHPAVGGGKANKKKKHSSEARQRGVERRPGGGVRTGRKSKSCQTIKRGTVYQESLALGGGKGGPPGKACRPAVKKK